LKLIQKLKNIKIKICGIKNFTILNCCNELEVNYFGLMFYKKSPRYIEIEEAKSLIKDQKNKYSIPVGVFVNHKFEELIRIVNLLNLNYVQLHGEESNEYILNLKKKNDVKILKVIKIENKNDLSNIQLFSEADFFLFDYKPKNSELPGGNAKSFDWTILKEKKIDKPWFISGGLNKNNLNDLLNILNPYGIDISSGVEDLPGIKNEEKIKEIVEIINE
tara:strand:+ start:7748 stop:8404 length:657 start_codon:yes stop_codon:yes gene_type:complete